MLCLLLRYIPSDLFQVSCSKRYFATAHCKPAASYSLARQWGNNHNIGLEEQPPRPHSPTAGTYQRRMLQGNKLQRQCTAAALHSEHPQVSGTQVVWLCCRTWCRGHCRSRALACTVLCRHQCKPQVGDTADGVLVCARAAATLLLAHSLRFLAWALL